MNWPFPSENQDPWYDVFRDMVVAQDASGYAAREDRNVFMGGGGLVSFTSTTGVLAWDENFEIFSPVVGFLFTVTAGSVVLQDGQLCYVDLVRSPTGSSVLTLSVSSQAPPSDTSYVVALRRGSDVYFRFGSKVRNGESINPFESAGEAGSDTYERSATFSIPDLSSASQEATLGRTAYGGSLVALSLELTEAVIAGSITVTIKRDGVSTLVAVLDVSNPTSVQTVEPINTWPVSSNSALTVLVEPSGYDNASGDPGGLTVNLALTTGLSLAPTDIVDASNTIKGVTKLSVAAATANNPIAVGDNDPRMSDKRVASGLGTTGAPVVVDTAAPPTAGQILKATSPTAANWQDEATTSLQPLIIQTGDGTASAPAGFASGVIAHGIANGGTADVQVLAGKTGFAMGKVYSNGTANGFIAAQADGSFARGYAKGLGTSNANITAAGDGSLAAGRAAGGQIVANGHGSYSGGYTYSIGGGYARIETLSSLSYGALAQGFALSYGAGGARITVNRPGARAFGKAYSNGTNTGVGCIQATRGGALASGYSDARGVSGKAYVQATGYGASAMGFGKSQGGSSYIYSSGAGSFASGFAESSLAFGKAFVMASSDGAFAQGQCTHTGGSGQSVIQASSVGAHASGSVYGNVASGINCKIAASGGGSFARGVANQGDIHSDSFGSFANGFSYGVGSVIGAEGDGATALGYAWNGGSIYATQSGAFAFGWAYGTGSTIQSYSLGSLAFGAVEDAGIIRASGTGSFAGGYANAGFDIMATFAGSFAFGRANTGNILASALNAVQFGEGTNAIADSLQIGLAGMRIRGTTGFATPQNGDIGVDGGGNIQMHSNGVTTKVAGINASQQYTKNQHSLPVALIDAAVVLYTASDSNIFTLEATNAVGATREIDNPTGLVTGMTWQIWFSQDGAGGRSLTFDTFYDWGDEGAPDFSAQVGNVTNILTFVALSTTQIAATALPGFA